MFLMLQKTLLPLLAIFMTASLYMIFQYAPKEKIMGDVQRIFYFHMGYVLVFTFAFTMNLIHSIRFLRTNNKLNLKLAYIHAEIGVVFTLLTLVSGMIWAKPVWGTWWTTDPQLTTTLILFILYFTYLFFHKLSEKAGVPRYSSIFAIIAFIDLPIVYISVRVMRGISPVVFGGKGGGIAPEMMDTLLVTMGAFFFLYIYLINLRVRLDKT